VRPKPKKTAGTLAFVYYNGNKIVVVAVWTGGGEKRASLAWRRRPQSQRVE